MSRITIHVIIKYFNSNSHSKFDILKGLQLLAILNVSKVHSLDYCCVPQVIHYYSQLVYHSMYLQNIISNI